MGPLPLPDLDTGDVTDPGVLSHPSDLGYTLGVSRSESYNLRNIRHRFGNRERLETEEERSSP